MPNFHHWQIIKSKWQINQPKLGRGFKGFINSMNVYTSHLQSFNFFRDINKGWTDNFCPNQTTIFHCFFTSNTPDLEWETDRTVSLRYLAASLQYVCLAPKEGQIMASVSRSSWRATNCTSAVSSASVQGIGLLRRIGVLVTFIGETLRALFNKDWAAC